MTVDRTYPILDIAGCQATRQTKRVAAWEPNFEKNYIAFARELAQNIAKNIIEDIRKQLEDPFCQTIGPKNKIAYYFNLEIVKAKSAQQIKGLTPCSCQLPPFEEWFERALQERDPSRIDSHYFEELMAMVGQVAEKDIYGIFWHYTARGSDSALQYKVTWIRNAEDRHFNHPHTRDNSLRVELWLSAQGKALVCPGKPSGETKEIQRHRIEQKQLAFIRWRNIFITALIGFVAALVLFRCVNSMMPAGDSPK